MFNYFVFFKRYGGNFVTIFANFCVRVRFAPSPTGLIHVGGLKTALINQLYAKSRGGILIFRLEDTDRVRYNAKSVDNIIRSLTWLGIHFDEGLKEGRLDDHYVQSNRLMYYQNAIERLIADRKAYYCFCSSQRLDFLRKEQNRRSENSGYDRKCLKLTSKEIAEKLQENLNYVVRLKIEENCEIEFYDEVFGSVSASLTNMDSDPIIRKSDGYPVYHLANVVDDHLMGITHVIRGQEWLVSTPKHILLYRAFGWKPPNFAHLPLIMKSDGQKISKRDPDFHSSLKNIDNLIEYGFNPAVVTFWLMSCGGGLSSDFNSSNSLSEITEKLSLSRISKHGACLSDSTLHLLGRSYFRSLIITSDYFESNIAPFLIKHNINLRYGEFDKYFQRLKHRMTCLKDFTQFSYLWDYRPVNMIEVYPLIKEQSDMISKKEIIKQLLLRLLSIVNSKNECVVNIDVIHEGLCSKASAMKCLRKCLINKLNGPRIFELLSLLTEDEIICRVNSVLSTATDI